MRRHRKEKGFLVYVLVCVRARDMWQSPKCLIKPLIVVLFSPIEQVINEMTDGGADYCFECVGLSSLVHEAFACCRKVSLSLSLSKHASFQS